MDATDHLSDLYRGLRLADVPVGIYVVTRGGKLVECNNAARAILRLPAEGSLRILASELYRNPQQRMAFLQEVDKADAMGLAPPVQLAPLGVGGKIVWVRDISRPIRDPQTHDVLGYIGCLADVTEEQRSRELIELLPVGVYRVTAQNTVAWANEALARLFSCASKADILGKSWNELFGSVDESNALREQLENEDVVQNARLLCVRQAGPQAGETFFVSIAARRLTSPEGHYNGHEGTVVDVTAEENYRRLLEVIPVGTFLVRSEGDEDVIRECNDALAKMFDFQSADEMKGTRVRDIYQDFGTDYERFEAELRSRHNEGKPLVGFVQRVKTRTGRTFDNEVSARLLVGKDGNVYGRAGVVRDVSDEVTLRHVRDDIGKVLHALSSTLVLLQGSLVEHARMFWADADAGEGGTSFEDAVQELEQPVKMLVAALGHLVEACEQPRDDGPLPATDVMRLRTLVNVLETDVARIPHPEHKLATLGETAREVIAIGRRLKKGHIRKQLTRNVISA